MSAPFDHVVDAMRLPFERRLHSSVRGVANESGDSKGAGSSGAFRPEEDSLDLPGDDDMNSPGHDDKSATCLAGRDARR